MTIKLIHGDTWKLGSSVVLSLVLVNLVDGDGGMNDRGLNSLLLDDGLDVLVDVVVDVLTSNGVPGGGSVLGLADGAGVLELSLFGGKAGLGVFV